MSTDEVWEFKTVEERGKQLLEDGRSHGGKLNQRMAELTRDGWDLIALSAHECRFRRRKRHVAPVQVEGHTPARRST
ncbi:MAG TPA: hypothetical protein VIR57_07595 [Chloroflexota bacterium]